jgi:hypothetical protein
VFEPELLTNTPPELNATALALVVDAVVSLAPTRT